MSREPQRRPKKVSGPAPLRVLVLKRIIPSPRAPTKKSATAKVERSVFVKGPEGAFFQRRINSAHLRNAEKTCAGDSGKQRFRVNARRVVFCVVVVAALRARVLRQCNFRWCLARLGRDRVGGVHCDSALAVGSVLVAVSAHSDEALLTPARAPAVLHFPVV